MNTLVSYSMKLSTMTNDPGLYSWNASFMLCFGVNYCFISFVVIPCVPFDHCDAYSCQYLFWSFFCTLSELYGTSHFSFILATIATNNTCGFSNPVAIFILCFSTLGTKNQFWFGLFVN